MYSDKCSEGLGFDHLYVTYPCNSLIEDYTEIFYTVYRRNVSSIQCKMGDTRFVPGGYKRDKVYSLVQLRDVCQTLRT
jgi:hypothetical protein